MPYIPARDALAEIRIDEGFTLYRKITEPLPNEEIV
jgi:hypothetical protein